MGSYLLTMMGNDCWMRAVSSAKFKLVSKPTTTTTTRNHLFRARYAFASLKRLLAFNRKAKGIYRLIADLLEKMTPGGERETAGRLPLWGDMADDAKHMKRRPVALGQAISGFRLLSTGSGSRGKRKAASPMDAARSVTGHSPGIK